jgi:hypothetical protein
MVDILPVCPAPQTGPELLAGVGDIIAFNAQYLVVLDMQFDGATPPAIESRCCAEDFDTIIHSFENI